MLERDIKNVDELRKELAVEMHALTDLSKPDEWAYTYFHNFLSSWLQDQHCAQVFPIDRMILVTIIYLEIQLS